MTQLTCLLFRDLLLIVLVAYAIGAGMGELVRWLVRVLWIPRRHRGGP